MLNIFISLSREESADAIHSLEPGHLPSEVFSSDGPEGGPAPLGLGRSGLESDVPVPVVGTLEASVALLPISEWS